MKVVVENLAKKCGGRICRFTSRPGTNPGKELETPMVMLYTRGASLPHISKEVLEMCNFDSNVPLLIPLNTTLHMQDTCQALKTSITSFAGLADKLSFVVLNDPTEEIRMGLQDKISMSVMTRCGRHPINSEKYMDVIEAFQPDFFHVLCDGETPSDASKKRLIKSLDKSKKFFIECLERHKKSKALPHESSFLIAAVEGGYNEHSRKEMLSFLSTHENDIDGYFLDGLHLNGLTVTTLMKDDINQLYDIVDFCMKDLPEAKPKFMFGPYPPPIILQLVKRGVDIFDTSYAYLATQSLHALLFDVEDGKAGEFAINLSEEMFKEDFSPLKQGCTCVTCLKHTRAYIHHLMNCKELLGSTLLMIHNTHHYLEFFKAIRRKVKEDKLDVLIKCLDQQYTPINLTEKVRKEKRERLDEDDNVSMLSV